MKKRNQILATILTLVLCMGLVPTTAWAAVANVIIAPTLVYQRVYNFDENNVAMVQNKDRTTSYVTVKDGKVVPFTGAVSNTTYYHHYDPVTSLAGYENSIGTIVIPAIYQEVGLWQFHEEDRYSTAIKDGKWGIIDRTGKQVLPFTYDDLWRVYAADKNIFLFSAQLGDLEGIIDATGKIVLPIAYQDVTLLGVRADGTPLFSFSKPGEASLTGIVDGAGKEVLPPLYSYIWDYSDGYAITRQENADGTDVYGFVDEYGKPLPIAKYDDVSDFQNGLASVGIRDEDGNSLYGFIDKTGKEVIAPSFYGADDFTPMGLAVVSDSSYHDGLIDKTGKFVVPFGVYDSFSFPWGDASDPFICVNQGVGTGFITPAGKEVLPCIYNYASHFFNGLAVVRLDGMQGIIDTTGNFVLPLSENRIEDASESLPLGTSDYVWIESGGQYGVAKIDRAGKATPPPAIAFPVSTPVLLDGGSVECDVYALKDANGNNTNYFKLRDVAEKLNGTAAQFQVGWDGTVNLTSATAYTPDGSEGSVHLYGSKLPSGIKTVTKVDGKEVTLDTVTLTDDEGKGHTYYKIRDLGAALGFNVSWDDAAKSITIDSTTPYAG